MKPTNISLQANESDLIPNIGDTVFIPAGYPTGYDESGRAIISYFGKVSEIINNRLLAVEFPNYRTRYVDFGINEIHFTDQPL
jgi:hypothetical protein